MTIFYQFINLLFPKTCCACSQTLIFSENILCTDCLIQLPQTNIGFSNSQSLANRFKGKVEIKAAYSFLKYSKGGKVQKLLHNLKYKNRQDVGIFMGNLYGNKLKSEGNLPEIDILIAIPLHEKKMILRGFNQSDLIAQGLSESLDVPHETNIISRVKATETQTRKSRIDRFFNVDNVFEVVDKDNILGRKVGLVDDVLTTGATIEVCAIALLEAGAKEVSIFSLAAAI
jgi:ComF family protein